MIYYPPYSQFKESFTNYSTKRLLYNFTLLVVCSKQVFYRQKIPFHELLVWLGGKEYNNTCDEVFLPSVWNLTGGVFRFDEINFEGH
jgi:hypothetical protein